MVCRGVPGISNVMIGAVPALCKNALSESPSPSPFPPLSPCRLPPGPAPLQSPLPSLCQERWFHCAMGIINIFPRQQSIAFTNAYTDGAKSRVGFVVPDAEAAMFPGDAANKVVGVVKAYAATTYFTHNQGVLFNPVNVIQYASPEALFEAVRSKLIKSAYVDSTTAHKFLNTTAGFQMVHARAGWSDGVAYGCHPEYGDMVAVLNAGQGRAPGTASGGGGCTERVAFGGVLGGRPRGGAGPAPRSPDRGVWCGGWGAVWACLPPPPLHLHPCAARTPPPGRGGGGAVGGPNSVFETCGRDGFRRLGGWGSDWGVGTPVCR